MEKAPHAVFGLPNFTQYEIGDAYTGKDNSMVDKFIAYLASTDASWDGVPSP